MGLGNYRILVGDVVERLAELPAGSIQCVVTSPPYWGLRDYGVTGQLGLEPTPDGYVANMVAVFREVRRVMRDDATCWVNLGDTYGGGAGNNRSGFGNPKDRNGAAIYSGRPLSDRSGTIAKNLVGIPWRVAFALQADGWWLRSEIIWAKPNPMPESVSDRPTKSHEQIFLLSKSARYFYDADAVRETRSTPLHAPGNTARPGEVMRNDFGTRRMHETWGNPLGRNLRTVWNIATQAFPGAHFATYPEAIPERCIKAGTSERGACAVCGAPWERMIDATGGSIGRSWHDHASDLERGNFKTVPSAGYQRLTTGWRPGCTCNAETVPCVVLDPFLGSGTTLAVARLLGRDGVGIELNPKYAAMAEKRIQDPRPAPPLEDTAGQELFAWEGNGNGDGE